MLNTKTEGGDMMNNHIKFTKSLATVALVATVLLTVTPAIANAQTTNGQSHTGFFQGLLQFIENEFGLNKSQVQSAVQQYKTERNATITPRPTMTQAQMQAREQSRLDKLVSSGKINSTQEQSILSELATVQSQYNWSSLQNDTPSQRQSQIQAMQNTLKTWAQSQGINPMYVMPFGGMRGGRGMMRGHGGRGNWGNPTGAPTPTPGS